MVEEAFEKGIFTSEPAHAKLVFKPLGNPSVLTGACS